MKHLSLKQVIAFTLLIVGLIFYTIGYKNLPLNCIPTFDFKSAGDLIIGLALGLLVAIFLWDVEELK